MTAAQAAHVKWNGTTWTRPRLGLLCLEERRIPFARALLRWMAPISRLPDTAEPSDPVEREALARLQACIADGSMRAGIDLWKVDASDMVQELRLLATASAGDTAEKSPVLSQLGHLISIRCPSPCSLWALPVTSQSAVSKLANLEKIHPGTDSQLLNQMFLYSSERQEAARAARLQPSLRSDRGGGLTEKAQASCSSKVAALRLAQHLAIIISSFYCALRQRQQPRGTLPSSC